MNICQTVITKMYTENSEFNSSLHPNFLHIYMIKHIFSTSRSWTNLCPGFQPLWNNDQVPNIDARDPSGWQFESAVEQHGCLGNRKVGLFPIS